MIELAILLLTTWKLAAAFGLGCAIGEAIIEWRRPSLRDEEWFRKLREARAENQEESDS